MKLSNLYEIKLPKIFDRNHRKTQYAAGIGEFFCVGKRNNKNNELP
jgi:hypothetical protein